MWKDQTRGEVCSVSPSDLASEEQRVGLEGHGAIRRGRRFGENEADQHVQANVVGCEVAAAEEAGDEAQQTGEKELRDEKSISRSGGKKLKCRTARLAAVTHLLKLLHGKHFLGEFQNQTVIHGAAKHLWKKTKSQDSA